MSNNLILVVLWRIFEMKNKMKPPKENLTKTTITIHSKIYIDM